MATGVRRVAGTGYNRMMAPGSNPAERKAPKMNNEYSSTDPRNPAFVSREESDRRHDEHEEACRIAGETREVVFCEAGQHHVAPGKTVNARGWCNLCLKDAQRGKPTGTTARERGLK